MKWFTAIWAFYLLALSIVPCSDAHNSCNDTNTTAAAQQTHQHNQDNDDSCAPFCHCSCCSLSIAITDPLLSGADRQVVAYLDNKVFIRDLSFLSRYFGNIWQPPRMNA